MDSERFKRVKELFCAALELEPEERSAYLKRACPDNPDLLDEVKKLLDEAMKDAGFLKSPVSVRLEPESSGEPLPLTRIGQYQLKNVISTGGMGTVYEAVQEHPHRTVAVKVMRAGVTSKSALRRFEYEAQILANLRHSNIAQIIEAGTHREEGEEEGSGVPFFVMEYIPNARPLTEYAWEKKLSIRERLMLFMQVCDAVHHGHQKGIIHRDLKPANLLVDAQGQVKIIDFGVARATDSDIALTTQHTDVGQLIGTVQYMSPEQCEADPHGLDTRSDVYSLGVVLYELLCERLPYDVRKVAVFEATRRIREEQPKRPSTTDRALRGDVETIVLKALEKDRDRRYPSSLDLHRDIDRYLKGESITARPPSVLYQFRTFARRNKALVIGTTIAFAALLMGFITSTSFYFQAAREADMSKSINAFFSRMLESADPVQLYWVSESGKDLNMMPSFSSGVKQDISVADMIQDYIPEIDKAFSGKQELEARVRETIGTTLYGKGFFNVAELQLEKAHEIYKQILGRDDPNTLRTQIQWASLLRETGEIDNVTKAIKLLRSAHNHLRQVFGDEHPNTLNCSRLLAFSLKGEGRFIESEKIFTETLEIQQRVLGNKNRHTLSTMITYAVSIATPGRYVESSAIWQKVHDICNKWLDPKDFFTIYSELNLVLRGLTIDFEDPTDACKQFEAILSKSREVLGDNHFITSIAQAAHAFCMRDEEMKDTRKILYKDAYDDLRRNLGEKNIGWLPFIWYYLMIVYIEQGAFDEIEDLFHRNMEVYLHSISKGNFQVDHMFLYTACALHAADKVEMLRPYIKRAIDDGRLWIEKSQATPFALYSYALFLLTCYPTDLRAPHSALKLARKAAEIEDEEKPAFLHALAMAYYMTGNPAKAVETEKKAIAALPIDFMLPFRWHLERHLVLFLLHEGDKNGAEHYLRRSLEDSRKKLGKIDPLLAYRLARDALFFIHDGQYEMAKPLAQESLEIHNQVLPAGNRRIAWLKYILGSCYAGMSQFMDAEPLLLEGYSGLAGGPSLVNTYRGIERSPSERIDYLDAMESIIKMYDAWGKTDQANEWRELRYGKKKESPAMNNEIK